MTNTVQEYLKQDRQWPRHLRLAHAKMHRRAAVERAPFVRNGEQAIAFWDAIIAANAVTSLELRVD